jgi:hypothetical protein
MGPFVKLPADRHGLNFAAERGGQTGEETTSIVGKPERGIGVVGGFGSVQCVESRDRN